VDLYHGLDRGLALQATLEVEPADKGLSPVFRIVLVIGPSLIERSDSEEASNLLARKTHLFELSNVCYSLQRLSEFHSHPPVSLSRQVTGCTTATPYSPRSSRCLSQFVLDKLRGISHTIDVSWRYLLDTLLIITSMILTKKEGRGVRFVTVGWNVYSEHSISIPTTAISEQDDTHPY
jgi:hypothetical protein